MLRKGLPTWMVHWKVDYLDRHLVRRRLTVDSMVSHSVLTTVMVDLKVPRIATVHSMVSCSAGLKEKYSNILHST